MKQNPNFARQGTLLPEDADKGFGIKRQDTLLPEDAGKGFGIKRQDTLLPEDNDNAFGIKRQDTMLPEDHLHVNAHVSPALRGPPVHRPTVLPPKAGSNPHTARAEGGGGSAPSGQQQGRTPLETPAGGTPAMNLAVARMSNTTQHTEDLGLEDTDDEAVQAVLHSGQSNSVMSNQLNVGSASGKSADDTEDHEIGNVARRLSDAILRGE